MHNFPKQQVEREPMERSEEDDWLKIGYLNWFQRNSFPIAEDPNNAFSPDLALNMVTEKENFRVPEELTFPNIEPYITEKYRTRIQKIWGLVQKNLHALSICTSSLAGWWMAAPIDHNDPDAVKKVEESPIPFRPEFKNSAIAVISDETKPKAKSGNPPERVETSGAIMTSPAISITPPLQVWKSVEEDQRFGFYRKHKEYMAALRTYYEFLLRSKKVDDGTEGDGIEKARRKKRRKVGEDVEEENREFVLAPSKCPTVTMQKLKGEETVSLREYIVQKNRWARYADGLHQILAVCKTQHHEQDIGRLRKTSNVPFAYHPFDVTMATFRDVVPYIIEEERIGSNSSLNLLLAVCALHDILEDTDLNIGDIRAKTKAILDAYDASLMPLLNDLGAEFGMTGDQIIKKYLDLLGKNEVKDIRKILRILSNNIHLDEEEARKALRTSIAGTEKTKQLLGLPEAEEGGINEAVLKSWNIEDKAAQSKTFQEFEEEYDEGKMAKFLIKLDCAKGDDYIKQFALIIKNEDRAHNIQYLDGMPLHKQFATLRATASRLIAWQMLDYNHRRPVFNSLERLIQNTIWAYERLEMAIKPTEDPEETARDQWSTCDNSLLAELYEWQAQLRIRNISMQVPKRIEEVVSDWTYTNSEKIHY